jgi:predicted amidohydrolase YtcJ
MLAGGSDWPVSTMDPLAIMQTGVTHLPTDHPEAEAWNPDERLDLQVMLQAHTVNASHALRFDDCRGLLPGHEANFLILERSLFAQPIQQLHQTRVLCTVFRGEPVYGADTD